MDATPPGPDIQQRELRLQDYELALIRRDPHVGTGSAVPPQSVAVSTPSVLSPLTTHLNVHFLRISDKAKKRASAYPLKFACRIGSTCWRFFQGADPAESAVVRDFVAKRLQPHVVIRLNEWPDMSVALDARVRHAYGPRCTRVLYVGDFLPGYIRRTDPSGMVEHALALTCAALFDALLALLRDWPRAAAPSDKAAITASSSSLSSESSSDSDEDSDSEDDSIHTRQPHPLLPYVVYVHCQAGHERSRFVMEALHGVLYAFAMRQREPRVPAATVLRAWAERQACFKHHELSLATLLAQETGAMFTVFAHVMARLLGVSDAAYALSILETAERTVSIRGNYHNVCGAGSACVRHMAGIVRLVCLGCQMAFFCSVECIARSGHAIPISCPGHFDAHADMPVFVQASALEQSMPRRRRLITRVLSHSIPGGSM